MFLINRTNVNILDIIILLCLVPAIIHGLSKGFVDQAISLVALVAGAWLSFKFSEPFGVWLKAYLDLSGTVLQVIAFVLILVFVVLILRLAGKLIEKFLEIVMLGWLDKLLGMVFSIVKATLFIGLLLILFDTLNETLQLVPARTIGESVLYPHVKSIADVVFPYLKELIFNK